ncbi:hypothetical protein QWZ13_06210 [Reinekea marina]|uniref:hypothetical protein n=1 Tax=Reinekea marina TaxID=1310421 RepID=UPI0025B3173B|nr:hypothetical protein [Reinekea marina]MDN3648501.1 hypothetical protein [Reinekea marina]
MPASELTVHEWSIFDASNRVILLASFHWFKCNDPHSIFVRSEPYISRVGRLI